MFPRLRKPVTRVDPIAEKATAAAAEEAVDRQGPCPLPIAGHEVDERGYRTARSGGHVILLRDTADRERHARLQETAESIRQEVTRRIHQANSATAVARRGGQATAAAMLDRAAIGESAIAKHERNLVEIRANRNHLLARLPEDAAKQLVDLDRTAAAIEEEHKELCRIVDELRTRAAEADRQAEAQVHMVGATVLMELASFHRDDTGRMTALAGPCAHDLWKSLHVLSAEGVREVLDGDNQVLARF